MTRCDAYYRCRPRAGDRADAHQARCQEQSVPTGTLDAVVWADLCQVLSDPAVLAEAVQRAQSGWLNDDARTARQHDRRPRRATLDRQRQRLIDAYAAEAVALEELQTRVRALEGRRTDLTRGEQQLATSAEQQAQVAVLATQVEAFRATIAHGLDEATTLAIIHDRPHGRANQLTQVVGFVPTPFARHFSAIIWSAGANLALTAARCPSVA